MSKLWQYWSVNDLTQLLESRQEGLLSSLEEILPPLMGEEVTAKSIYQRNLLSQIATSFLDSEYFANSKQRADCLNRLPPEILKSLLENLNLSYIHGDFQYNLEKAASPTWTEEFANAFISFFSLPSHFLPSNKSVEQDVLSLTPPTPHTPVSIESAFKQLKDYQFDVFLQAASKLSPPSARFIIQMPTGSGKTRTCMELICHHINESELPATVVWFAHSQELCEQAVCCFLDVWPHVAKKHVNLYRSWGKHSIPKLDRNNSAFVVAGFQKINAALSKQKSRISDIQNQASLIVVDEAHRAEAPTFKKAIESVCGKSTRIIGLTATPGRSSKDETENLAEFFLNQIVELPKGESSDVISMLRARGILSHAEYIPIVTQIDIELTSAQLKRLGERFDFSPKVLESIGRNTIRNLEIVKRIVAECKNNKQVLFFACSVEHSQLINSILVFLGYNSGHVDGTTHSNRRSFLIDEFKNCNLQVLCNFGVLSTGFDAPKTDVVFISRPTNSPVLYSQMIGRGLRGPIIGGTDSCRIIDVRDNILGYGDSARVYDLFEDYWIN